MKIKSIVCGLLLTSVLFVGGALNCDASNNYKYQDDSLDGVHYDDVIDRSTAAVRTINGKKYLYLELAMIWPINGNLNNPSDVSFGKSKILVDYDAHGSSNNRFFPLELHLRIPGFPDHIESHSIAEMGNASLWNSLSDDEFVAPAVEWIREHEPSMMSEIINYNIPLSADSGSVTERKAHFESTAAPIVARVQEKYTPDFVSTFHWEQFSTESVNYSKVPKLSELLGHVFLLTDSYGMRLAYDTHSSEDGDVGRLLTRETAKSGLVHFAVLNEYDENIVALMDDTGAFQGSDYQSKPIAVRFSSYSHETNKYGWGKPNNIISTNGYVLGDANMGENFNYLTTGSVSLSIEKTDRPGIYHLVYYVTTMADIKKGQQMRRVGNYYATLELVK